MVREYRILPVQVPVHGLKDQGFIESLGFELFRRDDIRLVSMGVYDTKKAAKKAARQHADPDDAKFV